MAFIRRFGLALTLGLAACTAETSQIGTAPAPGQTAGSSEQTAIKAESIAFEYQWIARHRPGWKPVSQGLLINDADEPFDLITIEKGGKTEAIYFDISSFFGTGFGF
ncbi:hypothetical protein OEW28_00670 [Defluviimonas sp. WL0002]|uniref:Uncharacterized protein n=1 Tax=Albidovulum marisflavi TaxID=2984159 RepID=A0ABT2Z7T4_9RHOB|nr:hypothetical protein [Defluviimonas sp. WL0002]MCV2867137.1 hypothetical protein [Defluviimonas sp. WL0002]